ncbi:hypothetical protein NO995_07425 [Aestuariibaculum sp. M13]|uniref:hypothetical protein n=1 Tax=Aestuariibaculum sp. M13 TaxID=2967132 RepID=UPI002159EE89|nr:hypothetical protein [Aestuariibaculum sp. M13]MCR8667505.1 hypothetical protein [Aestuariibaculum sp. M13]
MKVKQKIQPFEMKNFSKQNEIYFFSFKRRALLLLVLLVFKVVDLSAQEINVNGIQEDLVGNWVFELDESMTLMDARSKAAYGKMKDVVKTRVDKAYKGRRFIFRRDGSFSQVLENGREINGTWQIVNQLVEILNPNRVVRKFKVKEVTANKLVLIPIEKEGKPGNILFNQWSFVKGLE